MPTALLIVFYLNGSVEVSTTQNLGMCEMAKVFALKKETVERVVCTDDAGESA